MPVGLIYKFWQSVSVRKYFYSSFFLFLSSMAEALLGTAGSFLHDYMQPSVTVGKPIYRWYEAGTLSASLAKGEEVLGLGLHLLYEHRKAIDKKPLRELLAIYDEHMATRDVLKQDLDQINCLPFYSRIIQDVKKRSSGATFLTEAVRFHVDAVSTSNKGARNKFDHSLESLELAIPNHQERKQMLKALMSKPCLLKLLSVIHEAMDEAEEERQIEPSAGDETTGPAIRFQRADGRPDILDAVEIPLASTMGEGSTKERAATPVASGSR
ncbi:hypothetical protein QCA50_008860 [Cerrena zonata]|uniref:Uncharacterized protein n=1 Tax=Cerrena zonata TaxID=2478898 RepID=A0AAW0G2B7_9APHY